MATADPTAAINSAKTAYDVACTMLNEAGGERSAALWRRCAAAPMAALLYSASPASSGGGLPRVKEILAMPRQDAGTAVVDALTSSTDPNAPYLQTAWTFVTDMDPRQAASIAAVISEAIAPYTGEPA